MKAKAYILEMNTYASVDYRNMKTFPFLKDFQKLRIIQKCFSPTADT